MALTRYMRYLPAVLGFIALGAAAPAPTPAPTMTHYQGSLASPTCVVGVPAVPVSDGAYPITWYATVTPSADGPAISAHYKLESAWSKAHRLDGNHFNGSAIPYDAMKCQYKCNGADKCVSFFTSNVDGTCQLYDALIEPALFVYAKEANPIGGYNKLCNPPPALGARGGAKRDEVVISSSLTNALPVTDNCTESQVKPAESWTNYAPDQDTLTTHGRYTFTNTDTGDGAGFETTHKACHTSCTGFGWCKSVFVSYNIPDSLWGCTLFDVVLKYSTYVEVQSTKNTWPFGFNQVCPI